MMKRNPNPDTQNMRKQKEKRRNGEKVHHW